MIAIGFDHLPPKHPPLLFDLTEKRVFVAGHTGMVGSAIVRRLASERCTVLVVGSQQVDLRRQIETERWLDEARPDAVVLAAGRVGGIHANSSFPAEFIVDNSGKFDELYTSMSSIVEYVQAGDFDHPHPHRNKLHPKL